MAIYKMKRVIRIGKVVSMTLWAATGITAGSGFATTEMRIIMIRVIDRAYVLYPTVNPILFVDDLAADMCGPASHIVRELGGHQAHCRLH